MSLHVHRRPAGKRSGHHRVAALTAVAVSMLVLAGCSAETKGDWERVAMPEPVTVQAERILDLWQGAWIAAMITGGIVWGLIFFVIWRYRRRSADEIPVQTRYNLPLEVFYTIAPIIMVVVMFSHTVRTQNFILDEDRPVDNTVEVVGQQWTWTFNHGVGAMDDSANEDAADQEFPYSSYVYESGTASRIPSLYIPVDKTTRFNLHSPDVIHSLGVPGFLMKMDVIPGRVNHFAVTPTETGVFRGKCFELCGVYHSRMLFELHVVTQDEYDQYLQGLADNGNVSDSPVIGGDESRTQVGLAADDNDEEGAE